MGKSGTVSSLTPDICPPMLYSMLSLIGTYSMEDLKNFRQWGSVTPGHPEVDFKRGVENILRLLSVKVQPWPSELL